MAAAAASPYPKDVEVGFAPFAGGGATNGGGGGGLPLLKAPSIKSQYAAASTPRRARTAGDHDDPEAPFPLPRFPVAHTSAAFEAVAARKSLILTPPEIYAECAHHGEGVAGSSWGSFGCWEWLLGGVETGHLHRCSRALAVSPQSLITHPSITQQARRRASTSGSRCSC